MEILQLNSNIMKLLVFFTLFAMVPLSLALENGLARTPPMGIPTQSLVLSQVLLRKEKWNYFLLTQGGWHGRGFDAILTAKMILKTVSGKLVTNLNYE